VGTRTFRLPNEKVERERRAIILLLASTALPLLRALVDTSLGALNKSTLKIALVVFLCVVVPWAGSPTLREADAVTRPNVLFILTDDLDAATYERFMDATNNLVEREGVKFENATYSMSVCCPSRASILRGQYPHNTFVWDNEPPNGGWETFKGRGLHRDTYATRMRGVGYRTAYFGKLMNGYGRGGEGARYVPPGWDHWMVPVRGPAADRFNLNGEIVEPDDSYHDGVIAERSLDWIEGAAGQRPFMAAINFHAPHKPMDHPDDYNSLYRGVKLPIPPSFNERDRSDKPGWIRRMDPITDAERAELSRAYRERLRSIEFVDRSVRRLVDLLRREGELSSTYIFFYSDNGYHMGQHRLPEHDIGSKARPYVEDVRFPIVMRGPGIPRGVVRSGMVQNVDLRATFEDVANATSPAYEDGTSLLPYAESPKPFPRQFALSERLSGGKGVSTPWKALYGPDTSYHLWGTGEEEFYDLRLDPYQLRSDSSDPRASLMRAELKRMARCDAAECYSTP
jgi:N-acetylglucosamine-6-sulfatase